MSGPGGGDDEDENTNVDSPPIDPATFAVDLDDPAVSRTKTDADPPRAPAAPTNPPVATVSAPPPTDPPSQPAGRMLTPVPALPRERTRTPAPIPPPPPDAARERTRTPAAGRPIVAPPPTPDAARERTRTPAAGRPIGPPPPTPDAARERTKTPAPGRPITPPTGDASAQPPPAIARTTTPAPVDATRERTKTPAPGRPITPAAGDGAPAQPPRELARANTPAPAEAARERTKTPAPGRPITPAAPDDGAPAQPPQKLARAKTPAPAGPGRPITPATDDTVPATAGSADDPPPQPPRELARAKTPPPDEPGRPITPAGDDTAPATAAATGGAPAQPPQKLARAKTPAPAEPARERTKTPAPGRPITPDDDDDHDHDHDDDFAQPEPAIARATTPAPADETKPAPVVARATTQPPGDAGRERARTPAPVPRRAATAPTADSEGAPVPASPRRTTRPSTEPPTANDRIEEARSLPTASIPEAEPWLHRIARIAPWVIVALPALFQVFLLSTAITGRLLYPYDLEWMEGGMLHHAQRIHGGLGIYVEPSIEFIPYLYTPLYPSLLALFGGAFGLSYTLGRAFSVLALIGIAVVAAVSIASPRHEHARRAPAYGGVVIALGLFAAAYPFMEGWYDLVRADTFFLFMVTAAIAGLPRWAATGTGLRGHGRVAAGAVLLALAFFCKQTGIIYVAFGGLIVLVVAWRRVPVYVLMAGLIGLGGTWLLERTTNGWFWVYIQKIHAAHDFNWDRFWKSFENILWQFPAMTIVIAAALVVVLVTVIWRRTLPRATHPLLLWSSTFAVSTVLGAIGWGTEFAHFNAYMPAFLHGALAAGAAIPAVYGCTRLLHGRRAGGEIVSSLLALAAAVPLAYACWDNRWDPKKYMPTERDVAAGDRLIARIRAIEGDVWMPSHPWYLMLAGKSPRVHRMGVRDVTWRQARTVEGLEAALQHHGFAALVLDGTDVHNAEPATSGMVNASYRAAFKLPADERPRVFTGARVSPDSIWLPAIPAHPPQGTRVLFDFEQVAWDGWTLSGPAWGARPEMELTGHGLLIGATGRRYATSMHGGDVATGRVTSPVFVVDGKLSIKLGGGTDATKLRVELWVGGAIVATAGVPAPGGDTLRTVTLDPGASRGAEATLVFVDDSPAGHLDVDDVWVTP